MFAIPSHLTVGHSSTLRFTPHVRGDILIQEADGNVYTGSLPRLRGLLQRAGNGGFAQKGFFNTDVLCKKFFNSAILGPALRGDTLGPLPRPSAISLCDGWGVQTFYRIGGT